MRSFYLLDSTYKGYIISTFCPTMAQFLPSCHCASKFCAIENIHDSKASSGFLDGWLVPLRREGNNTKLNWLESLDKNSYKATT